MNEKLSRTWQEKDTLRELAIAQRLHGTAVLVVDLDKTVICQVEQNVQSQFKSPAYQFFLQKGAILSCYDMDYIILHGVIEFLQHCILNDDILGIVFFSAGGEARNAYVIREIMKRVFQIKSDKVLPENLMPRFYSHQYLKHRTDSKIPFKPFDLIAAELNIPAEYCILIDDVQSNIPDTHPHAGLISPGIHLGWMNQVIELLDNKQVTAQTYIHAFNHMLFITGILMFFLNQARLKQTSFSNIVAEKLARAQESDQHPAMSLTQFFYHSQADSRYYDVGLAWLKKVNHNFAEIRREDLQYLAPEESAAHLMQELTAITQQWHTNTSQSPSHAGPAEIPQTPQTPFLKSHQVKHRLSSIAEGPVEEAYRDWLPT